MTTLTIVGGVYHEKCVFPEWDQIYGSAGRAAAATTQRVPAVKLVSYASNKKDQATQVLAAVYGFAWQPITAKETISFEYVHSMSRPMITPEREAVIRNATIDILDEAVLRFGMMEGSAKVIADWCVYDPQSPFHAEPFGLNGSTAKHLAVVGNQREVAAMGGHSDWLIAAKAILAAGAEAVVTKRGPSGAAVVTSAGVEHVPPFQTKRVFTIGSGDVFAAIFAAEWCINRRTPLVAAEMASRAVASYVDSMSLPVPNDTTLAREFATPATIAPGRIYLASPFFSLGQRWLVEEARRCLMELGMEVFSPIHDVGAGPAEDVAPADIEAIHSCDAMFAILDGLDSGTIFEVGYARALGKPVYALAQTVQEEDLKMVAGSGCLVGHDLVTMLHRLAWRS